MTGLLAAGLASTVDLIYLDPPFSTGDRFGMAGANGVVGSYSDAWTSLEAYLDFLTPRLAQMHRLLAEHGALFLHCDWRTSAHLRLRLEALFGAENFRNEIIWRRGDNRGRKSCARHLGRTTDSILYFVKNAASPAVRFHPPVQVRRHRLRSDGRAPAGFFRDTDGRYFKTAPRGDYTDASIARLRSENRVYETRTGRLRIKYFLACEEGAILEPLPVDTLWTDLPDAMHLPAGERFGYPTQKPLGLLKRIVACASDPGDRVFDPFCGSGTTVVAAAELGRRFWGCDVSPAAVNLAAARLAHLKNGPAFDRCGSAPIAGEIPAEDCGLSLFTREDLPESIFLAATESSRIGRAAATKQVGRGEAGPAFRGVRMRRGAGLQAQPSAATSTSRGTESIPEKPLLLEIVPRTAGAGRMQRIPLRDAHSGEPLEIALGSQGASGYYFHLIDGLGQRFHLPGPVGG